MGLGLQALGLSGTGATGISGQGERGLLGVHLRRKRSRHWICPDFHLPYDKFFDEMSYRELVFGMVCVAQGIMKSQDATWLRFVNQNIIIIFKI